jgi:hypothetical protein
MSRLRPARAAIAQVIGKLVKGWGTLANGAASAVDAEIVDSVLNAATSVSATGKPGSQQLRRMR